MSFQVQKIKTLGFYPTLVWPNYKVILMFQQPWGPPCIPCHVFYICLGRTLPIPLCFGREWVQARSHGGGRGGGSAPPGKIWAPPLGCAVPFAVTIGIEVYLPPWNSVSPPANDTWLRAEWVDQVFLLGSLSGENPAPSSCPSYVTCLGRTWPAWLSLKWISKPNLYQTTKKDILIWLKTRQTTVERTCSYIQYQTTKRGGGQWVTLNLPIHPTCCHIPGIPFLWCDTKFGAGASLNWSAFVPFLVPP